MLPMTRRQIDRFRGEHRFLSNFWPSPVEVDGLVFPTVEHAYQAFKSEDPGVWREFAALPSPVDAKRAGRKLAIRPDWDDIKIEVMYRLLVLKFAIPDLRRLLLDTGDAELVEGNAHGDVFWGVDERTGKGENNLGKLLAKVREEIRAAPPP